MIVQLVTHAAKALAHLAKHSQARADILSHKGVSAIAEALVLGAQFWNVLGSYL